MLSAKLIENILVGQDPERLIAIGDGEDAYRDAANHIYERLIRDKINPKAFLWDPENANTIILIEHIRIISFVFSENFGCGIQYNGHVDPPTFWYDKDYIEKHLDQIKVIAKLIIDFSTDEI